MLSLELPGCAADWMEHVVATGGEPYLRTPEEDLPFLVRHSLDVAAAWAALAACAAVLLRQLLRGMQSVGAWGTEKRCRLRAVAKAKAA